MTLRPRGILAALFLGSSLLGSLAPSAAALEPVLRRGGEAASRVEHRTRLLQAARPLLQTPLRQSQRDRMAGSKAPDRLRCLVVGCDFSDSLLWGRDRDDPRFEGFPPPAREGNYIYVDDGSPLTDAQGRPIYEFSAHDSVYFDIQMRKVADYFATVSRGRFTLQWDVHPDLVNLPEAMGWYGADLDHSLRLVQMAKEVVEAVDPSVDLGAYDTLILIHAGAGQETDINGDSPEQIFSNYLDPRDFEAAVEDSLLEEPGLPTDDGGLIQHVLILPETETQDALPELGLNGFFGLRGVYCFEIGLRLGMLSLADFTPSEYPDSQGIGNYGLMGYGLFTGLGIVPAAPCAMNRMLMGWVDAVELEEPGRYELPDIARGVGDTLLARVSISDREYFLLEYRLQDPDGTFTFTFDDLNGNRVPDYLDASSADGTPASSFDPATDTWESTLGAEWDYFMSEFPVNVETDGGGRGPGRGNGLYIWHVDERVIADALRAGTNTINADPHRKGVDLEEGDGIQDLDTLKASRFLLGWDRDRFAGEGLWVGEELYGVRFGPDTLPSTDSADGAATGIEISAIDSVQVGVVGCEVGPDCPLGGRFLYRERMGFTLALDAGGPATAPVQAARDLESGPVAEVRLADLDGNGTEEILVAGAEGLLYAFDGTLAEWADGDADPTTVGVLARAVGPGGAPLWLGAPVVGDLDGDGAVEILLGAAEGVYGFDAAGAELRDGDGDPETFGLFLPAPLLGGEASSLATAPLLAPHDGTLDASDPRHDRADLVLPLVPPGQPLLRRARLYFWDGTSEPTYMESNVTSLGGARRAVLTEDPAGVLRVILGGPVGGGDTGIPLGGLLLKAPTPPPPPPVVEKVLSALSYRFRGGDPGALAVLDSTGALTAGSLVAVQRLAGPWSELVGGPLREGGVPLLALEAGDALHLLDRNLSPRVGGPYGPRWEGESVAGGRPAPPVLVDVDGDARAEVLWHDRVGRLHAVDADGGALPGWPVQGPAEPAGSPAVGDVDGDGRLEVVALGAFDALVGVDPETRTPLTRRVGRLEVRSLDEASGFAPWPQGGADAWSTGRQRADSGEAGLAASGPALEESSLLVYPNPAVGPVVRLRVTVRRTATLRAAIYSLEGQEVRRAAPQVLQGGAAMDLEIPVDGLANGLYLARVEAGGAVALRPFAVAR